MAGGCSGVCKQFLLLLWKNFLLQIRRPIGTIFEIAIPIAAVIFIIGLRVGIFQAEDRCFVTFDADPLTPTNPVILNNQSRLPDVIFLDALPRVILYTPNNNETAAIAARLRPKLPPNPIEPVVNNTLRGVDTEEDLIAELENNNRQAIAGCFIGGAGIVFDLSDQLNIKFTLRLRHEVGERDSWLTRMTSPNFEAPGPRISDNFYLSEGFLHLENAVGLSIIEYLAAKEGLPVPEVTVETRQFPFPGYRNDVFLLTIGTILPLLLMLAFIYSAGAFVKELVLEKETRIRESMFMMGLTQWILWASWYLKQFIFLLISVIVMTILIKIRVFTESAGLLIFIFLLLFSLSLISYCFLLSVFFDSARIGLLFGYFGWFLNYLPYLFLANRYDETSTGGKIAACMLSNTCMGLGIEVFARLENRQEGLQFDNVAENINLDDSFHMGYVYMMLIIDTIVYYLLAWYINGVKPGKYGVPKPLYFPFMPSYWTGKPRKSKMKEARDLVDPDAGGYDPTAHEQEPTDLPVGITIENLTKIYGVGWFSELVSNLSSENKQGQRKVAVNKLSLNMYKDQITALLGHNGAGKTTTMSILTGLFTPTSGSATINGYSILTDINQIRHSLGICPQHNVLFNRLTVREHLKFFCRLKGVWDSETVHREVESMIEDLQLVGRGNIPARALSGGMKRKLSVGIALVGGSEVVILDEPTSGMDPYARRATWDLLVKHKPGRTMLLTTHFMDEADLLGDRIAIMAEGQLKCSGSSLFLKSRYGVGYHMTVVKEQQCISAKVSQLVTSMIAGAKQVTDVGAELSFVLPSSSTPQFPALFDVLDARKTELGVSSFGVSVTTMEEVFIKVGEGTEETLDDKVRKASVLSRSPVQSVSQPPTTATIPEEVTIHSDSLGNSAAKIQVVDLTNAEGDVFLPGQPTASGSTPISDQPSDMPAVIETQFSQEESDEYHKTDTTARLTRLTLTKDYVPNTGIQLWFQQFVAMFLKRFYNSLRFFAAVITQLILPMIFVLLALVLAKTLPNPNENDEPRELRLDNSALTDNVTLFWAQLQEPTRFNISFGNVEPSSLGVTEFFDRTGAIQTVMMSEVQTGTNDAQCCMYEYQLLDKYCATRTESELQAACSSDDEDFGYTNCRDRCLSCCTAQEERLPSCTNPISQVQGNPDSNDFCPSSPRVSYEDALLKSPTGPSGRVDSEGTFVAEYLMRLADSTDDTASFFRRYQAGYTITARDPPYAVCGCENQITETTCRAGFSLLGDQFNGTEDCPYYTDLAECNFTVADSCLSCAPGASISGCSTVNGIGGNLGQVLACEACPENMDFVGSVYPTPDQVPVAVTVWYNNQPWHMSAAALNGFHNILLRETLNNSYTITVINHPQPRNVTAQIDVTSQNFTGYAIGTLTVFGYSFLIATFILFIVQEKETKAKHLQFVSGVHISSFWSAVFTWDLLNASLPVIISLILFAAFQIDGYTNDGLGAVFLLFVFVMWASIPLTYVFSFLFKNYLAAFGLFFCFYYFTAVVMQTVVFLITDRDTADTLHYIFLIFPSYGLAIGLNDIFINNIAREVCTTNQMAREFCQSSESSLRFVDNALDFPRPGIGSIITYLALEGVFFFMLTLLLEAKFFFPDLKGFLVRYRNGNHHLEDDEVQSGERLLLHGEDTDVFNERKKVMLGKTTEDDVVIINDLHKVYSKRLDGCTVRPAKAAVQGISLAIPNGECFGLLGVNGAGKTTTFSIITGDIPMTEGTASISGFDIRTNLRDVQQRIGYCPQFDALIDRLTGRELLTMYGRLRGIPERLIKDAVEAIIQGLDLSKHGDKKCGTYSGGNKRKLSTGIALVGNPSIILLDEPTSGMDVATRRHLWDVLTTVTQEGRSIVLTTHSMEECEALCTRLAIMVNGRFKCLGSIQHLKNKYGAGFTLHAKVQLAPPPVQEPLESIRSSGSRFSFRRQGSREASVPQPKDYSPVQEPEEKSATPTSISSPRHRGYSRQLSGRDTFVFNPFDATALHNFIREAFPGAILLEEHQGAVGYQLPGSGITWSSIFRQIESNKERLGIVDYSVSQTTLEQVFINFAKEQEDSDD